jgi:hypothetical protein
MLHHGCTVRGTVRMLVFPLWHYQYGSTRGIRKICLSLCSFYVAHITRQRCVSGCPRYWYSASSTWYLLPVPYLDFGCQRGRILATFGLMRDDETGLQRKYWSLSHSCLDGCTTRLSHSLPLHSGRRYHTVFKALVAHLN